MGFIGGEIGYRLLRLCNPSGDNQFCGSNDPYEGRSKLDTFFGDEFWAEVAANVVLDFGCGFGAEAIEIAQRGAKRVIGLDIRPQVIDAARQNAEKNNVSDRCVFTTQVDDPVDVIVSLDAFEHFEDPEGILRVMSRLVRPEGSVWVVFGPPWYHPIGGHLFSVFPWAHLIFTERALIRWRSDFKTDGATRFHEVEGGLNQMTIKRFLRIVEKSPFQCDHCELIPIRRARFLFSRLTREYFTSCVKCRLVLKNRSPV